MKKMSDTLVQVTKFLNDHQFHDGTSIGDKLNITRAAVWKVIKKLEAYNIPIKSVKGKGYILEEPFILLDQVRIKSLLQSKLVHIELLEEVGSTNQYLKVFSLHKNKIVVCVAEMQTEGRGRFDRYWHSPFGQNLYFSLRYPFHKDISELSGLSLVVGLATCKAIETACHLTDGLRIKWPNDIVVNHKKLSGSLVEIQAESHGLCNVIIGIGMNINMQNDTDKKIQQDWTSVSAETKRYHDRNELCALLIDQLATYLKRFEEKGLKDFVTEWKAKDYLLNKTVRLKSGQNIFEGKGMGINVHGHLMLKLSDGTEKAFATGDTTLRVYTRSG